MKKHPNAAYLPIDDAMDLKVATGNKASELGAFDKRGDKTANAEAKVYSTIAQKLNDQINKAVKDNKLGDLENINKQYEEVLPILGAIIRRKPILKSNLPISLQDVAEGSLGAVIAPSGASGWNKTLHALGIMAAGKIAANPVTTKLLYKASKGKMPKGTGTAFRQAVRSSIYNKNDEQEEQ
jgi:hypothetical protein